MAAEPEFEIAHSEPASAVASSDPNVMDPPIEGAPLPDLIGDAKSSSGSRRGRRGLYCFHCNRQEMHALAYRGSWIYSFLVGMTFSVIWAVGPFKCVCCGRTRLMMKDGLNPRYFYRHWSERAASSGGRSRRRS